MNRALIITAGLLALTTAAWAWNAAATCPYDGDQAYFRASKYGVNGPICQYGHTATKDGKTIQHQFWTTCE